MAMHATKPNAKSGYWGRRRVINRTVIEYTVQLNPVSSKYERDAYTAYIIVQNTEVHTQSRLAIGSNRFINRYLDSIRQRVQ